MKGTIGLILLALGIVVASAFGARNGARHVAYRSATAEVANTEGQAHDLAVARQAEVGLPPPEQRLREWFAVGGFGWAGGLVLIGVGAGLARMQQAEDNAGTGSAAVGRVDYPATIAEARRRIEEVKALVEPLPMDADSTRPRELLDAIRTDLLEPLVDGRGQLVARHGLAGFAEYFGTFSAAERNLNRCWSALTDGHTVVAREALAIADETFAASLSQYEEVEGRG